MLLDCPCKSLLAGRGTINRKQSLGHRGGFLFFFFLGSFIAFFFIIFIFFSLFFSFPFLFLLFLSTFLFSSSFLFLSFPFPFLSHSFYSFPILSSFSLPQTLLLLLLLSLSLPKWKTSNLTKCVSTKALESAAMFLRTFL